MDENKQQNQVIIEDTDITFEKIINDLNMPEGLAESIESANILLLPNKYDLFDEIAFPEGTIEFFDFIRESPDKDTQVEILADDETFQLLQLHSSAVELAQIILVSGILPIALGLITNYMYDLLKKRNQNDVDVKVDIICEDKKGNKRLKYEGPVSGLKAAFDEFNRVVESNNIDGNK